ncbi:MAG TPA: HEPN domain-containing protein [Acidimicrobiia bacterium]|nr:HEPN domain-containing protein [Acidimicrobiia bacterium]
MTILDELLAEGLIEPAPPDEAMAAQWIADSGRHIDASAAITTIDPTGAYVLAYDAARKAVAAALLLEGYRVRSRPGAHQALARFARELSEQTQVPQLGRFDRLRRNRNRAEYGSRTFGSAEVEEAIGIARAIRDACRDLV